MSVALYCPTIPTSVLSRICGTHGHICTPCIRTRFESANHGRYLSGWPRAWRALERVQLSARNKMIPTRILLTLFLEVSSRWLLQEAHANRLTSGATEAENRKTYCTVRILKCLLTVRCSRLWTQPFTHGPQRCCLAPRDSGMETVSKRTRVPSMSSKFFLNR